MRNVPHIPDAFKKSSLGIAVGSVHGHYVERSRASKHMWSHKLPLIPKRAKEAKATTWLCHLPFFSLLVYKFKYKQHAVLGQTVCAVICMCMHWRTKKKLEIEARQPIKNNLASLVSHMNGSTKLVLIHITWVSH